MKKQFCQNLALLFARICVGLLMLPHGWTKLKMLVDGKASEWLDPIGIGPAFSLSLSTAAEFFASLFIIAGFFTRLSSLVLIVNMGVALTVAQASAHDMIYLYIALYGVLLIGGAGDLSVSKLLSGKSENFRKLEEL